MNTPDTNVWIRNFAWRAFRDPADEDYLLARQSVKFKLHYQFYWNAQQSIEKYLKCIILLNGGSARHLSHDLAKPFSIVQNEIAPDLIPLVYCPPRYFIKGNFTRRHFESFEKIVDRFNRLGDPMQRYRTLGTEHPSDDLHKLDELVFYLRRICFPLEMVVEGKEETARTLLNGDRAYQLHPIFSFYDTSKKKLTRRNIFEIHSWQNFSFFENRALRLKKFNPGSIGMTNSALNLLVNNPDEARQNALRWVIQNVRLRKEIVTEIEESINLNHANGAP